MTARSWALVGPGRAAHCELAALPRRNTDLARIGLKDTLTGDDADAIVNAAETGEEHAALVAGATGVRGHATVTGGVTVRAMEATGITVVSQLITDARSRFGAHEVRVLEVDADLLDEVMDHVLALGGQVGLDSAVVEGIQVRELPTDCDVAQVYLHGEDDPRPLVDVEE